RGGPARSPCCWRRGRSVLSSAMDVAGGGRAGHEPRGAVAGIDGGGTLCKLAPRRDGVSTAPYPARGPPRARALVEAWSPSRSVATGGGADRLGGDVAGVPIEHVSEFEAWARGAVLVAAEEGMGLPARYLLVSLGTGTSVLAVDDGRVERVG